MDINKETKNNYVSYHRENCEKYYTEIHEFLLDENKIPNRINFPKTKNKRKIQKKRNECRKMCKNNYRLYEHRLQIKYYTKNKQYQWKYVPFKKEIKPMMSFIHYNNLHLKKERMCKKIIENGYFWAGYTIEVENFIKSCGYCHAENNIKIIDKKPKIITTYGPHIRYQADIWYLPEELKKGTPFKYVLDCIDHFSKWNYSFLLKNKDATTVLSKIKLYFEMNGTPTLFHTDNGKEFKNRDLKFFLENKNTTYITSAPYHPQSNGCCEAIHKEIKKYLLDELNKKNQILILKILLQTQ